MRKNRFNALLAGKCPRCESGAVFEKKEGGFSLKFPKMHKQCPECDHTFEREPGYFYGAMYVSYALTVAESVAVFIICQLFFEEVFSLRIILVIAAVIALLSFVNFRFSRLIWMYMFTSKNRTIRE